MAELPTLGAPRKKSALPGIAVFAIAVGSLAGVVYWYTHHRAPTTPSAPIVVAPLAVDGLTPVADAGAVAAGPAITDGYKRFTAIISGPLESAIIGATNREVGAQLTQVVTRSLVWWVSVPGDLMKGDTLSVLYEERADQEPIVHAVRLTSRKFGKAFEAFRYKPTGSDVARFYHPDGTELEEHLADCPLESWEQITSLLRDGRRHKGVDFKTPVGSPVHATFDGTIIRKNWNFRSNGNCLEIQENGGTGRTAMFLHLLELPKTVRPGDKVKKGQVFAKSGNSGHSFAPHLHYQLMQGDRVVDPFKVSAVTHESLPDDERIMFDAAVSRLKGQLPIETIAGGSRRLP